MDNKIKLNVIWIVVLIFNLSVLVSASDTLFEFTFDGDGGLVYQGGSVEASYVGKAISFGISENSNVNSDNLDVINQAAPQTSNNFGISENIPETRLVSLRQGVINEIYNTVPDSSKHSIDRLIELQKYYSEFLRNSKIEVKENGEVIISGVEGEGNFLNIPRGYEIDSPSANKNAVKIRKGDYDFPEQGSLKIGKFETKVSLEKNSGLEIIKNYDGTELKFTGIGSLKTTYGNRLDKIKDATIRLDVNEGIVFADFVAAEKRIYIIKYNAREFKYDLEKGGRVVFDSEKNSIALEKGMLKFEGREINGKGVEIILDDSGEINQIEFVDEGTFRDTLGNLYSSKESSKESFKVLFGEVDFNKLEGNVVLIPDRYKNDVYLNGKVEFKNLGTGLSYNGLSKDALTRFDRNNLKPFFEVKKGDVKLDNGKHVINIIDGVANLDISSLFFDKNKNHRSFGFSYNDNKGKSKEFAIDEGEENIAGVYKINYNNGVRERNLEVSFSYLDSLLISSAEGAVSLQALAQSSKLKSDLESKLTALNEDIIFLKQKGVLSLEDSETLDVLELKKLTLENQLVRHGGRSVNEEIKNIREYFGSERSAMSTVVGEVMLGELLNKRGSLVKLPNGNIKLESEHQTLSAEYRTEFIAGKERVTGFRIGSEGDYVSINEDSYDGRAIPINDLTVIIELRDNGGSIDDVVSKLKEHAFDSWEGLGITGSRVIDSNEFNLMSDDFNEVRMLADSSIALSSEIGNKELVGFSEINRGNSYKQFGDYDSANKVFSNLIGMGFNSEVESEAYRNIGEINKLKGNVLKALQSYDLARISNPDNYRAIDEGIKLQIQTVRAIRGNLGDNYDALLREFEEGLGTGEYKSFSETPGKYFGQIIFNSGKLTRIFRNVELLEEYDKKSRRVDAMRTGTSGILLLASSQDDFSRFLEEDINGREDMIASAANYYQMVSSKELQAYIRDNKQELSSNQVRSGNRYDVIGYWKGKDVANRDAHYYGLVNEMAKTTVFALRENSNLALVAAMGNKDKAQEYLRSSFNLKEDIDIVSGTTYEKIEKTLGDVIASESNMFNIVTTVYGGKLISSVGKGLSKIGGVASKSASFRVAAIEINLARETLAESLALKTLSETYPVGSSVGKLLTKTAIDFSVYHVAEEYFPQAGWGISALGMHSLNSLLSVGGKISAVPNLIVSNKAGNLVKIHTGTFGKTSEELFKKMSVFEGVAKLHVEDGFGKLALRDVDGVIHTFSSNSDDVLEIIARQGFGNEVKAGKILVLASEEISNAQKSWKGLEGVEELKVLPNERGVYMYKDDGSKVFLSAKRGIEIPVSGGGSTQRTIRGMTREQIEKAGIQTRSFYVVASPKTAKRLKAGGEIKEGDTIFSWPTEPERAHLGEGVYSWDNLESAVRYKEALGHKDLKIVEIQFESKSFSEFKRLNVDNLGDKEANRWLEKYSLLISDNPQNVLSHEYEHVIRGTNFGQENYFPPEVFKKAVVVNVAD